MQEIYANKSESKNLKLTLKDPGAAEPNDYKKWESENISIFLTVNKCSLIQSLWPLLF
jgi:hypothetical protein